MIKFTRLEVVCRVLVLFAATAAASSETFYQTYLPAGISMGMSAEQVRAARPQAITSQSSQPSAAKADPTFVEMVEIAPQGNTRVAYWYRLKGGKLGAVTRSILTARMPIEHAQAGAANIANELKAGFAFKGQQEVVRSTGTDNSIVTAQLWEDKAQGLNLYFVTTNRELTVVIFDPKTFGKADFFIGPERMNDLNAHAEVVRSMTGGAATTPVPIVDLLPKVAAAGPAPAAAISTPSTPVLTSSIIASSTRATRVAQTSALPYVRRAPVWSWVVGVAALIVIIVVALKRRA